jgi:hypothetical protein
MIKEYRCPCCQTGIIEAVAYDDYGNFDYWCSNFPCLFNNDAKDSAKERWSDYLNDTYEDEHGERHYY